MVASTTPLSVTPLLSWISSRLMTSGDRRLFTMRSAIFAKVPSLGSRFSTLNVAMASSCGPGSPATSRARPPDTFVGDAVSSTMKRPKL